MAPPSTTTASPTAAPAAPRESSGRWNDVAEAALSLFSDRGYHGTTMKHVASELGVQAPSLYNHVGSKQEILARLMKTGMERMIAKQDEALASTDDVGEQLRRMTEAHVLVHTRHRRSALIGDRELRNLEEPAQTEQRGRRELYERRFRDTIARGVRQGTFKVDSAKLASFAIIEMATSVAVWFRDEGPLTETDVAREYGQMALRIVGAGDAA